MSTPNGLERNEVRVCFRFCKVFQHLLPPHSTKLDTFHFHHAVPKHRPGLWTVAPFFGWPWGTVLNWLAPSLVQFSMRLDLTSRQLCCKRSLSSYLWWTDIMGFSPQAAAPQKAKGAFRPTEFVEATPRSAKQPTHKYSPRIFLLLYWQLLEFAPKTAWCTALITNSARKRTSLEALKEYTETQTFNVRQPFRVVNSKLHIDGTGRTSLPHTVDWHAVVHGSPEPLAMPTLQFSVLLQIHCLIGFPDQSTARALGLRYWQQLFLGEYFRSATCVLQHAYSTSTWSCAYIHLSIYFQHSTPQPQRLKQKPV